MKIFFGIFLSVFFCFQSSRSDAALGGSLSSVEADKTFLSGTLQAKSGYSGYSIQEIQSDSMNVREYLTPAGVVFGFAWNGLRHPDFTQFLGSYASDYQKAVAQNPKRRGSRSSSIRTDHLVVQTWGHQRKLEGRAYDPSLVPSGVDANAIH